MEMKAFLVETFEFNSVTNKKLLEKIAMMRDRYEAIKFFSHLINCQYKWLARILKDPGYEAMSWWEPVYDLEQLEEQWNKSLQSWITYLNSKTDEELATETSFIGYDGSIWAATPKDIALQLNYHSIHHRGQIQMLIRQQGIEPDFVDYIGTKYRKIK
jgi:uncharacterized damage-inducible protein DinB